MAREKRITSKSNLFALFGDDISYKYGAQSMLEWLEEWCKENVHEVYAEQTSEKVVCVLVKDLLREARKHCSKLGRRRSDFRRNREDK